MISFDVIWNDNSILVPVMALVLHAGPQMSNWLRNRRLMLPAKLEVSFQEWWVVILMMIASGRLPESIRQK